MQTQIVRPSASLAEMIINRVRPGFSVPLTRVFQVVFGCMLIAAGAKVQVLTANWVTPVSLSTLAILTIAAFYGPSLAITTVVTYIGIGLAGLPVFATAPYGTIAVLAGPSGGYLVGFILGAGFVGWAASRGLTRRLSCATVVMLAGTLLILLPGAAWMAVLTESIKTGIVAGLAPFAITGAIKSVLAASIVTAAARSLISANSASE